MGGMRYEEISSLDLSRICFSALLGFGAASSMLFRSSSAEDYSSVAAFSRDALDSISRGGAVPSFILGLVVSFVCYVCMEAIGRASTLIRGMSLMVGVLLSLTLIVPGQWGQGQEASRGFPWYATSSFFWSSKIFTCMFFLRWLILSLVLALAFVWISVHLEKIHSTQDKCHRSFRIFKWDIGICLSLKSVIILTLFISICWFPVVIINGPVIIPTDTMVQLIQMRGFPVWDPMMMTPLPGYHLSDHHPFLDSYIYGLFDYIGIFLGNEIYGFKLLVLFQVLLGSFSLALGICWIGVRTELPNSVIHILIWMVSLIPSFSSYMTVVMKDSTWVPVFTIWFIVFAEIIFRLQKSESIRHCLLICLICLAILAGLMKKTSLYVTSPCMALLLFYSVPKVRFGIATMIPPIIVLVLIPSLLFPILKIAPGGRQEALGTPIQQVTMVLIDHPTEETQENLSILNRVFSVDKAKSVMTQTTVDPVKQTFKVDSTKSDIVAFLILWVKLFVKYPAAYFAAIPFVRNSFLIGPTYYTTGHEKCGWSPSGGYAILPEVKDCGYSWQQEHLSVPLSNILNRIPPFTLLGAEGIFTAWIPLSAVALCVVRKKWKNLMYLSPAVFMTIIQLLIPAYQTRYSIGFLFGFLIIGSAPYILPPNHHLRSTLTLNS